MRLFGGLVVLGQGSYTLTGTRRMQERPMQPLLDSLNRMGVDARSQKGNGCPPVVITANRHGPKPYRHRLQRQQPISVRPAAHRPLPRQRPGY